MIYKAFLLKVLIIVIVIVNAVAIAGAEEKETVVIVGGYGSTVDELRFLKERISNSVVIIPPKYMPLSLATAIIYQRLKEEKISGPIIFVAYSWGRINSKRFIV